MFSFICFCILVLGALGVESPSRVAIWLPVAARVNLLLLTRKKKKLDWPGAWRRKLRRTCQPSDVRPSAPETSGQTVAKK